MNKWYAKDMSRKMRSTLKIKNSQGYAIGQPPLGYKKDPDNPKLWVIDEEGAQIIEKIYNLRKQGESTVKIAKLLKFEKILIPSMYAAKKVIVNHRLKIREMNIFGQLRWLEKF